MANPRSASTRRALLSYSHLKELTDWPLLLLEDYQGILQDFVFTAGEIDDLDVKVINLQDSQHPNMSAQVQFLQQQLDGLPEFTIDTTGFTTDLTFITTDKVIA